MRRHLKSLSRRTMLPSLVCFYVLCACSGGQSYDDGSDALDSKSDEAAPDSPSSEDTSEMESPIPIDPPVLCEGCYVVHSAVTGNDSGELFVTTYFGASDSQDQVLSRYANGEWAELARWEGLPSVKQLWASGEFVYGVGTDGMWRYDLARDERVDLELDAIGVWGLESDSVFALTGDSVQSWDGQEWSATPSPLSGDAPLGIVGDRVEGQRGPQPVFVVSQAGAVSSYSGEAWEPPSEPLDVELNAVTADGHRLYAVAGDDHSDGAPGPGLIARFEDQQWNVLQDAPDDALLAVAASPDGRAFAVGGTRDDDGRARAVVWSLVGDGWQRQQLELEAFLWDAWCGADGACYAVGTNDAVLQLSGR